MPRLCIRLGAGRLSAAGRVAGHAVELLFTQSQNMLVRVSNLLLSGPCLLFVVVRLRRAVQHTITNDMMSSNNGGGFE